MPHLRRAVRHLTDRLRSGSAAPASTESTATESTAEASTAAELTRTLAELTEHRRHTEAITLITDTLHDHATDKAFLKQARRSATKAGAMTLQRQAAELQLETFPDENLSGLLRQHLGRMNETSPDWSPTIAPADGQSCEPITDPAPGRVLHVLKLSMPHRQSGYTMRTMYTLTGQRDAGLDVVATTPLDFPATAGVTEAPNTEEVAGIPHLRLQRTDIPNKQPWDRYLDDWASALAPIVAEQRPEVIHVHSGRRGYESALVALAVGQALDIPVVYEVRGFFESLWTGDQAWAEQSEVYQRRFDTETRCMSEAAAVVTLSDSMRDEIVARGVDPERVHVVPNGVDTDAFHPVPRRDDLVDRLGLADRFVFGYVSNLDHHREGHELLIRAAALLRDHGVPATALIVGDGSRRSELEELTHELGAEDVVVFTGTVPHDEVLDYYALYDVFVVPRVDERAARLVTPLKPYEAMAAGVPVVVSDLPALREVIGDGTRGRTFATGDMDSLAETLTELHDDAELRGQLATAGRDWVTVERQWSSNGARYRKIYDQVRGVDSPSADR